MCFFADSFGKAVGTRRNVPDCPVIPASNWCVGIVEENRKGLGSVWGIRPDELRRAVGIVASELLRNVAAIRKTGAGNGQGHRRLGRFCSGGKRNRMPWHQTEQCGGCEGDQTDRVPFEEMVAGSASKQ